jgi:hypothetical protein
MSLASGARASQSSNCEQASGCSDQVKVLDFGLAKAFDSAPVTDTGNSRTRACLVWLSNAAPNG